MWPAPERTPITSPNPLIGDWTPQLDGPDLDSPRAEIEAELANVMASQVPADMEHVREEEIERLQDLLLTATDKGGFAEPDHRPEQGRPS